MKTRFLDSALSSFVNNLCRSHRGILFSQESIFSDTTVCDFLRDGPLQPICFVTDVHL